MHASHAAPGLIPVGVAVAQATATLHDSGSESARLDAELLVAHVLGIERTTVLAHPEATIASGQSAVLAAAVGRRATGEPVAYIRGLKEFYGLAFTVDRRALIPRPDTERLVDLALERIRGTLACAARPVGAPALRVWDVGTGTGAIAVALAVSLRRNRSADEVRILATDSSAEAVALAIENVLRHGVGDIIELRRADLGGVRGGLDPLERGSMDLLVANLPYVPSAEVGTLPVAARFEPRAALDGGPDGLDLVRRLLALLPETLVGGGVALLEIGSRQAAAAASAAAEALPGWPAVIHSDLAGHPRVLEVRRAGLEATAP